MSERRATLVLGAAGFFGLAIIRALTAKGIEVLASDRVDQDAFAPRGGTRHELVRYVQRDIAAEGFEDLVAQAGGVIHAAAITPASDCTGDVIDDLLRVNLESFLSLLRAARAAACRRVLLVSSAAVYDQATSRSWVEDDATGGSTLYGAAKLAAELVGSRYGAVAGFDFAAVRPSSLYGAGETESPSRSRVSQVAQLITAACQNEPVRITNPDARTDWLCVDDAADAIALLWGRASLRGVFNLSSGHPIRFDEVVHQVSVGAGLDVNDSASKDIDGGQDRPAVIDNSLIAKTIGWRPLRTVSGEARALVNEWRSMARSC